MALLKLHRAGLIGLPETNQKPFDRSVHVEHTTRSDPRPTIQAPVSELEPLELVEARLGEHFALWREYMDRYHYLGYSRIPGAQARYLIRSGEHWLAALGYGPAAWKLAARDTWIGWSVTAVSRYF